MCGAGSSCAGSCRASGSGRSCYAAATGLGLDGSVRNDVGRRRRRGRGPGPARCASSLAGCGPSRPRWRVVEQRGGRRADADGRHRLHHRRLPALARRQPHPRRPGRGDLRRLPARAGRPGRPPVPAPVHHLHQLRAAVHDHHRPALRPAGHHDGRLPDVRRRAPRSTPTRPTGASTPSRSPARTAGRGWRWSPATTGRPRPARPPLAAARALLAAGGDRRGQGARRLPPGLRRDATSARSPSCGARKRRGDKPFAVMVRDLAAARRAGRRRPRLRSAAHRPGPARSCCCRAAAGAARRRPWRRATPTSACCCPTRRCTTCCSACPASPRPAPLVMTSGNLGGEPIASRRRGRRTSAGAARRRLAAATTAASTCPATTRWSAWSTARCCRCAAPAATPRCRCRCRSPCRPTLAVGADLKNTCCLGSGRYAWLSQHIGDMDDLATLAAFDTAERHLEHLTGVVPEHLVAGRPPALPLPRLGRPARRRPPGADRAAPPRARRRGDGRARARRRDR